MSEPPNPRTWNDTSGLFAIDLDEIVMTSRVTTAKLNVVTRIWLRHNRDTVEVNLSKEEHADLVKAFLIYRSHR